MIRQRAVLGALVAITACGEVVSPSRTPRYPADHPTLPGEFFRWTEDRVPVRYFADTRGAMASLVTLGLRLWERQFLYGEFRGVLVADSGNADVIVVWQDSVPPDVPPDTAGSVGACDGVTTILIDSANAVTEPLRVQLRVQSGFTAAQVAACLPRVTAHEIGHTLGLLRHSSGPDDLMSGPPRVAAPTARDRATAEVLYHTQPTISPPPP